MDSPSRKVLHVDDNPNVRSFVEPVLRSAGFDYVAASDGHEALAKLESESPDIVVLDILLRDPDFGGLDVCKRIRESGSTVPVIFLTVKDRTEDASILTRAFTIGGTDFVSKREELRRIESSLGLVPTEVLDRKSDLDELVARINAHLPHTLPTMEFKPGLRIDFGRGLVEVLEHGAWRVADLSHSQFRILQALAINEGRGVSKRALLNAAGVDTSEVDIDRTIQSHIWRLRQQIEPEPSKPVYILTYHRIGYRLGPLPVEGLAS